MPANLNALIRYKTIDQCLRNKYVPCTIEKLQEACADALGESRGRYNTISKRTIYDDLRVMRSDILGFNAPIICSDGLYYYESNDYSIFEMKICDISLLRRVAIILEENKNILKQGNIDNLLAEIENVISGETGSPFVAEDELNKGQNKRRDNEKYSEDDNDSPMFMRTGVNRTVSDNNRVNWSKVLAVLQ